MSDEIKKMEQELHTALDTVRTATAEVKALAEQGRGGQSELKEKIEKANKTLDDLETKNQELIAKQAEESKARADADKRIQELQVKLAKLEVTPAAPGMEKKMALEAEMKSLMA